MSAKCQSYQRHLSKTAHFSVPLPILAQASHRPQFMSTRPKQRPQVDFGTQSGPMLVIDGEVHARFVQYGGSRKYRVGVGSRDDPSLVVFVVSESEISFGEFARGGCWPPSDIKHTSVYLPEAAYEALRQVAFDERRKIHDLLWKASS
jgi:hypothetical protein